MILERRIGSRNFMMTVVPAALDVDAFGYNAWFAVDGVELSRLSEKEKDGVKKQLYEEILKRREQRKSDKDRGHKKGEAIADALEKRQLTQGPIHFAEQQEPLPAYGLIRPTQDVTGMGKIKLDQPLPSRSYSNKNGEKKSQSAVKTIPELRKSGQKNVEIHELAELAIEKANIVVIASDKRIAYYQDGVYHWSSAEQLVAHLRGMNVDFDRSFYSLSRSQTNDFIQAIMTHPQAQRAEGDFDNRKDVVCLKDGVYFIDGDELGPHSPDYLFTSKLAVSTEDLEDTYNHSAFDQFLQGSLGDNDFARELVFEIIGTVLGPDNPKACFLLEGKTNSGKSILLSLLRDLVGDPYTKIFNNINELAERFAFGDMPNKRLLMCGDLPHKILQPDALGICKQFCGADSEMLKGEQKNKPIFYFRNRAVLIMASNHPIRISEPDPAFANRLKTLFFERSIPQDQQNHDLLEELKKERGYVFVMAMKALRRLRKNGFAYTNVFSELNAIEIQSSNEDGTSWKIRDSVANFVSSWCVLCEGNSLTTDTLFQEYQKFCLFAGQGTEIFYKKEVFAQNLAKCLSDSLSCTWDTSKVEPTIVTDPSSGKRARGYKGIALNPINK